MERRDFLKKAFAVGIAVSVAPVFDILEAAQTTDLVVARGESPSRIARAAIGGLGGMGKFVSRGDIVVVKPNIGWDRTPEFAATTNPEVVAEVVAMCYEAGAGKVKVFDHTVNDPRRCYRQSGIADAAAAVGGIVSFVDERRFRDMAVKGRVLQSWPLYAELFEADRVINIPIAKTHGLCSLTLGMKNWMGIMGGWRSRIHQRIDQSLVDVSMFIRPALVVLDAVRILTANGPQGGSLSDVKRVNTLVAGTDQVAVDAFAATLFSMKGSDIGYIRIGHEAGLGTMDLARVRIKRINL